MIETSMRGTRLGALSLEREDTVPPAERVAVLYVCSHGHESLIPISIEGKRFPPMGLPLRRRGDSTKF